MPAAFSATIWRKARAWALLSEVSAVVCRRRRHATHQGGAADGAPPAPALRECCTNMRGPLCTACPAHTDWWQLTHLTASQCCHTEQVTGSSSWNRGPDACNTAVCLAHNDGTLRCRTRRAIRLPGVGMARRTRRSGGRRAGAKRSSPPSGQHFNALPRPRALACQD